MKKIYIIIGLLIAIIVFSYYFSPTIKIFTGGNIRYAEQDKRAYNLLTDDIIKNCPRISHDYEFGYATVDGPAIEVSAITFRNTTDISRVHEYLLSLNFKLDRKVESGEYWTSDNSDKTVHISTIEFPETTIIEVLKK
ncbi:hypothetical protein [Entomohabitans teleogrylli]|uniref:hypothetical protein n=1 Tax=Entomohabitans teleogrylli TaxID=1384589 RepID=UPI0008FC208E|nr:hypothetical protein [Entomohabitans teleogrylli]